jgi:hypothetical protein
MCSIRVRSTLGVSLLFALIGVLPSPAGPREARREASAKEVALAFARSWNARSKDEVLKLATVPFFGGTCDIGYGGSGPPEALVRTTFCKTEKQLGQYLDDSFHGPWKRFTVLPGHRLPTRLSSGNEDWLLAYRPAGKLPTDVQRIESYGDYRKKYLEKDVPEKGSLRYWTRKKGREILHAVLRPDDLIVYVGSKHGLSEGILLHFGNGPLGSPKVAGILGDLYPAMPGPFR